MFIVHSMGGLVVQSCLIQSRLSADEKYNISSSTRGLIFFGTPHGGSTLAGLGFILSRAYCLLTFTAVVDCIKELRVGSRMLRDMCRDFRSLQDQFRVLSFCGNQNHSRPTSKDPSLSIIQAFHRPQAVGC